MAPKEGHTSPLLQMDLLTNKYCELQQVKAIVSKSRHGNGTGTFIGSMKSLSCPDSQQLLQF
jgi:hypothetical protein